MSVQNNSSRDNKDSDEDDEDFIPTYEEDIAILSDDEHQLDSEFADFPISKQRKRKAQLNQKIQSNLNEQNSAQHSVKKKEEEEEDVDKIWAEMMNFNKPTHNVAPSVSKTESDLSEKKKEDNSKAPEKSVFEHIVIPRLENDQPAEVGRIRIEETYDFAGESIKVTKEVDISEIKKRKASQSNAMENVLQQLKKKKLTTKEKSAIDWEQFKKKEGIEDELKQAAKTGFLEKQAFLQRSDFRQYEKERDVRLKRIMARAATDSK